MKYKIIFLGTILGVLLFSACSEDRMDEIGTNPNSPTEVPIKLLMSQSTLSTAFDIFGTDLAWYSSVFCEQTTGVHGQLETADKRTGINSTIGNNNWNTLYATTLNDLNIIINRGSEGGAEEGNWTSVGIAKVLSALNFCTATDLWGEVPYFEALQGSENRTPVFDSQEEIYPALIDLLDAAIADLQKESIGNPGTFDFFYGGNVEAWMKAAYALKARILNRLSNVDSGSSAKVLVALQNAFESSADDMVFSSFTTDATGENPWFQELNDRSHHAISGTFFNLMDNFADPRMDLWFGTIEGEIVPAPNGTATTDQSGTIYSRAKSTYLTATSPLPIITYDELKFIEAEAYLSDEMNTEAYSAYLEAVEVALARADVAQEDIDSYLEQGNVAVGEDNLTQELIIIQKFISFWLFQPIEAYNDFRRTRIPVLNNSVGPAPERFPYPNDELSSNSNAPKDVSYTKKLWWAK